MKAVDENVLSEDEAMVRVEAKAAGAQMERSSIEWNEKTSNDASTQVRGNRWEPKGTLTSLRSVQRPTKINIR